MAEVYADSGNADSLSIDLSLLGSTGFGPSEVFTGESLDVAIIQFIPIIVGGIQVGVRIVRTLTAVAKGIPNSLNIGGKQFSKKLNRRAKELGLDVSNPQVRYKFKDRIQRVFNNADEVRKGSFRGQEGDVFFHRRGNDVVLSKPNGDFITILTNGAKNKRFLDASKLR